MSSLVFPFHDPKNIETKFLQKALPILKYNFENAFVSITPKTVAANPDAVAFLRQDSFFITNDNPDVSDIGDHFLTCYANAVKHSSQGQILHLCTTDRLSLALLSDFKEVFLADIKNLSKNSVPLVFIRSPKAWETHPQVYYAAESMVTEVGEKLFGKALDFTWCHLAITAQQLADILPNIKSHDLVIFAEIIYLLKDILQTKEVDWLPWEDPFIFGKDPVQLKTDREKDPDELKKRLGYVLPQINFLFEKFQTAR